MRVYQFRHVGTDTTSYYFLKLKRRNRAITARCLNLTAKNLYCGNLYTK